MMVTKIYIKRKLAIYLVVLTLLFSLGGKAQVTLYGVTAGGGTAYGTIFSITTPFDTINTLSYLLGDPQPAEPTGTLLHASDCNFYASSQIGGYADSCTIFRYYNGAYTVLINTDSSYIGNVLGGGSMSLMQGMDGNLYGMTNAGGKPPYQGSIYKLELNGKYAPVHFFSGSEGEEAMGDLIQTPDSELWGMTAYGGVNGIGNIFKCSTSGVFQLIYSMDTLDGTIPYGDLVYANDGNFYGMTSKGGKYGYGTLFRFSPLGTFTKLVDFDGNSNGASPYGSLIQATDGNLYGLTSKGGQYDYGTFFSCTLSGTLITITNFNDSNGANPMGSVMQASDGNLYGMCSSGGKNYRGTIFQYSLSGIFKKILDFKTGAGPMYGSLIEVDSLCTPLAAQELKTESEEVRVYPNPSNGAFTLQVGSGQLTVNSKVEIYNMLGEEVYTVSLNPSKGGTSVTTLDLSGNAAGIYMYRVVGSTGKLMGEGKIIIE